MEKLPETDKIENNGPKEVKFEKSPLIPSEGHKIVMKTGRSESKCLIGDKNFYEASRQLADIEVNKETR